MFRKKKFDYFNNPLLFDINKLMNLGYGTKMTQNMI